MAGRHQKPLASTTKHWTKAEIEEKQDKEKVLENFEKISNRAPKHLTELGKETYKSVLKMTEKLPVSKLDENTIVIYSELYCDYRELTDEIKELKQKLVDEGYDLSIDKQLTTKRRQRLDVFREMKSTGNLLGMSMESRLKLVQPDEPDEDPIAQIFGDNNE